MSRKSLLMVAAAVLSVTALSSAGGAITRNSSDVAPIVRELGTNAAPAVFGVRGEAIGAEDITVRADEGSDQHIVQTGLWSSVKKAAKEVGSTVKKAASTVKKAAGTVKKVAGTVKNGVAGLGKKVMDAGAKAGSKLPGLAKKAVTTTVKNLTPPIVKKVADAAKKAAQKIGTKIGKKVAKVIS